MESSRRNILILGGVVVVGAAAAGAYVYRGATAQTSSPMTPGTPANADNPAAAPTPPTDPRLAGSALGKADAPVSVAEWFSLTCPHCARFAQETFPQIQTQLIATGKLRYILRDFPLDQVALTAAMVARSLPPERYEPFCMALLASQDRWAFARDVNSTEELAKMAALAGMPRPSFDAAIKDEALRAAILQEQDVGVKVYKVDSTPSFIFDGPAAKDHRESGEMSYDEFAKHVANAAGT